MTLPTSISDQHHYTLNKIKNIYPFFVSSIPFTPNPLPITYSPLPQCRVNQQLSFRPQGEI